MEPIFDGDLNRTCVGYFSPLYVVALITVISIILLPL